VDVLRQWLKSLEVTPTIVALRNRADDIKRMELEKAFARLSHLSTEDRQAVESMASAMINKIVHGTMVTLKAEANGSGGAAFVEAARRFFNLDDPTPACDVPLVQARESRPRLRSELEPSEPTSRPSAAAMKTVEERRHVG
jgi:glutamyl-tRNA reductase